MPITLPNVITHPFMQLVLDCTFDNRIWEKFLRTYNDAKNDPNKLKTLLSTYHLDKEEQLEALASEDVLKINIQIAKEYSYIAMKSPTFNKPKEDGDLVGSTALLLKDWPAHQ